MNIVTPDSNTITFAVRTRPTSSYGTFAIKLKFSNEETYANKDISGSAVTASYNSTDFLAVTASINLTGSQFYTLQIMQLSGSVECNELYRGELYPTTASATILNSEPFSSYLNASSSTEYIIY